MKIARRFMTFLSAAAFAVCTISASITASAEQANTAVKDAQEGVYYIQMFYHDGDDSFPVQGGTCFFISDDMLLTCEHVVTLDDATEQQVKSEAKTAFGSYSKNNLTTEVMLQSDISVEAELVVSSEDGDWAVLQLTEDIEVQPLTFGNSDSCENTQSVFAIGYPSVVSNYETVGEFSRSDVTTTGGTITKVMSSGGVDLIQHSALMSAGNSGGPLVDENGAVIGINRGRVKDSESESYFYATATEQVLEILNQKKIGYTRYSGSALAEQNESMSVGTIILITAAAVFAVCLVVVLVVLSARKKPAKEQAPTPVQSKIFFTLARRKNGERCAIDKEAFIVGKGTSCDYSIEGNETISRTHARFIIRSGECFVTDMGSSNGTFVNGKRLTPDSEVKLQDGDILKISDEEFVFHG